MIDPLSRLHGATVHRRRVRRLVELIEQRLPGQARVLDVGCGDGLIGSLLSTRRPDLQVEGVDVLVRPRTHLPVHRFDGHQLPFADAAFDALLLIDVLHHSESPLDLLRECGRVARDRVIIKDHLADGWLARPLLRAMDYVGNAGHGVALPYNYWTHRQWSDAFGTLGWRVEQWTPRLALYPAAADWLFGRDLHFLACCRQVSNGPG